ncbi:MAG: DUF3786 domain-containing protein [Thermodesulfovibrionales bacterium]|nr:DUF3786 domain-containing protein [Thermodesulfovibrionales bacterium]
MAKSYTFIDLFNVLPKTNCRKCGAPTCMAFSLLVFKGEKRLTECPFLATNEISEFENKIDTTKTFDQNLSKIVEQFKVEILSMDLESTAKRLGGEFSEGKLTIKVLGKDFTINQAGNISTDLHMHPWVLYPILSYFISCKGVPLSGIWIPFRELKEGKKWNPLFVQRCIKPLKNVADSYTEIFKDMVHIFGGRQIAGHYKADISVALLPLPLVPILISYWEPEEGFESDLDFFFDKTVEENLNIEALYALCSGLVMMFEKLAHRHAFK